jgi:hypothetical protein
MLDEGTLLHAGPIGGEQTEGTVLLELIDDTEPVVSALRDAGATVKARGRVLEVSLGDGDIYDTVRDVVAARGASIRRLDGSGGSLEEMFLHHGAKR